MADPPSSSKSSKTIPKQPVTGQANAPTSTGPAQRPASAPNPVSVASAPPKSAWAAPKKWTTPTSNESKTNAVVARKAEGGAVAKKDTGTTNNTTRGPPLQNIVTSQPQPTPQHVPTRPKMMFGSVVVDTNEPVPVLETVSVAVQPSRTLPSPVPVVGPIVGTGAVPATATSPISPTAATSLPRIQRPGLLKTGLPRQQVPIPGSAKAVAAASGISPVSPTSGSAVVGAGFVGPLVAVAAPVVAVAATVKVEEEKVKQSGKAIETAPAGLTTVVPEDNKVDGLGVEHPDQDIRTLESARQTAGSPTATAERPAPTPAPAAVAPPPPPPAPKPAPAPPKPKSWADLVRKPDAPKTAGAAKKPAPQSSTLAPLQTLAELLKTFAPQANSHAEAFQPRGLINNGNMCYMNSVLQPLLFCPPFLNLFRKLSAQPVLILPKSPSLVEAMLLFSREFDSPKTDPESGREKFGEAFPPEYVYDALQKTKRLDSKKGRQEDAEEFFGFLLDGLHEEFFSLVTAGDSRRSSISEASTVGEQEQWQEVGPKNRTANTRSLTVGESPVSRMFGGKWRSVLRCPGQKDSITVEPFTTLPLDISSDDIRTIEDALLHFTEPETISGYMSSTKGKVDATKQNLVDSLPPVLILHLKRFVYSNYEGVQKLQKRVGFKPTLQIDPVILSPAARAQPDPKYRLFAVVYHLGHLAGGGHYTCSVLRSDGSWLNIDDQTIERTREEEVIAAARPGYDPYLLFYIRS